MYDDEVIVPYYVDKNLAGDDGIMTHVAKHLSGRSVVVELRTPSTKNASGTFTRTEGIGHIQIEPKLTHDDTLYVFCHEVAHCLLHWQSIRATERHLAAPRTCENESEKYPNHQAEEIEADDQANKWLEYARSWMAPDGDDYLTEALEVLITYGG